MQIIFKNQLFRFFFYMANVDSDALFTAFYLLLNSSCKLMFDDGSGVPLQACLEAVVGQPVASQPVASQPVASQLRLPSREEKKVTGAEYANMAGGDRPDAFGRQKLRNIDGGVDLVCRPSANLYWATLQASFA
jgi:hypothetical protein